MWETSYPVEVEVTGWRVVAGVDVSYQVETSYSVGAGNLEEAS